MSWTHYQSFVGVGHQTWGSAPQHWFQGVKIYLSFWTSTWQLGTSPPCQLLSPVQGSPCTESQAPWQHAGLAFVSIFSNAHRLGGATFYRCFFACYQPIRHFPWISRPFHLTAGCLVLSMTAFSNGFAHTALLGVYRPYPPSSGLPLWFAGRILWSGLLPNDIASQLGIVQVFHTLIHRRPGFYCYQTRVEAFHLQQEHHQRIGVILYGLLSLLLPL